MNDRLILTIGHSTLLLDSFIDRLTENSVTMVADIRTVPRSRYNPQFNKDVLPNKLAQAGIGYLHLAGLGGFRRPCPDSVNGGWRNASFRGFADYMQTKEFEEQREALIDLSGMGQVVLMCA